MSSLERSQLIFIQLVSVSREQISPYSCSYKWQYNTVYHLTWCKGCQTFNTSIVVRVKNETWMSEHFLWHCILPSLRQTVMTDGHKSLAEWRLSQRSLDWSKNACSAYLACMGWSCWNFTEIFGIRKPWLLCGIIWVMLHLAHCD